MCKHLCGTRSPLSLSQEWQSWMIWLVATWETSILISILAVLARTSTNNNKDFSLSTSSSAFAVDLRLGEEIPPSSFNLHSPRDGPPCFSRQGLWAWSSTIELHCLVSEFSSSAPRCPFQCHGYRCELPHPTLMWMMGIQTQGLMLARKDATLSQLPNPPESLSFSSPVFLWKTRGSS